MILIYILGIAAIITWAFVDYKHSGKNAGLRTLLLLGISFLAGILLSN